MARHSDGTFWATLTDFSTGIPPNLTLHLNEGELVKNADVAWMSDGGLSYDIAPAVREPASPQEIDVEGGHQLTKIHSVTIIGYSGPDYPHFGSAPVGSPADSISPTCYLWRTSSH
jgi:hypothetical protein